jgi:uncharacterized membrane protein
MNLQTSGAVCREIAGLCRELSASLRGALCDEAIQLFLVAWIASLTLAMTVLDVLFEN